MPRPTPEAKATATTPLALRLGAWLGAPLLVGYPIIVYYSMQHFSARVVSVVLLVGISPLLLRTLWRRRNASSATTSNPAAISRRQAWNWVWPILAITLIGIALFANSLWSLLLVPVCINGALLLSFGLTLLKDRPLIERFARLQHDDLSPDEQRWCRLWTIIWTTFFGFNIVLAASFTLTHSVEWWAYYNGLLSYVVMGLLFASEYVVRKCRFQRFGEHGLDRALRWFFLKLGLVQ